MTYRKVLQCKGCGYKMMWYEDEDSKFNYENYKSCQRCGGEMELFAEVMDDNLKDEVEYKKEIKKKNCHNCIHNDRNVVLPICNHFCRLKWKPYFVARFCKYYEGK